MVADVIAIGAEKAQVTNLRGSSLSVSETIAPSETFLDPVPEDDDPDVTHAGWRDELEAARQTGKPYWTLCGKFVHSRSKPPYPKHCRACREAQARIDRGRTGRY